MEISEENKQTIRKAIRIIHDICAEREDEYECCTCPFRNNKEKKCIFYDGPNEWPLSEKTPVVWNYCDECEEK